MKKMEQGKKQFLFVEILVFILMIGIISVVRFSYIYEFIPGLYGETKYWEIALIKENASIPYMAQGIAYVYTWLLHFVLWFFGNISIAGMYLQIVLQVAALACLYVAIRKISNIMTASVATLSAMALPSFLWSLGEMTPGNLLLLCVCFCLILITSLMKRMENQSFLQGIWCIAFFLVGICNGLVVILDSIGIILFVASLILFAIVKMPKPEKFTQKRWFHVLFYILGNVLGTVGFFTVKSILEECTFGEPYLEYARTYFQINNVNMFSRWGFPSLLCVGVMLFCICIAIVKRIAFGMQEKKEPIVAKGLEIHMVDIDSIAEQSETKHSGIKYIENPLPVPKRHVKKEMNYAFEPPEDMMHYDIQNISKEDDFDIV